MKRVSVISLICVFLLSSLAVVSADYSVDISGLKQSYSIGEQITYTVLLLENGSSINRDVEIVFSDDFGKNEIRQKVTSNIPNTLLVNENFSSLGWHAKVNYGGKEVIRPFFVSENSKVEFVIEGNKLIIKNKGNVVYTRDVKVKIGEEENRYTQNIPIGGQKIWVLVAPEGTYNIEISDGLNTFTKNNVPLNSPTTGNAIGVMSGEFQGTGFASTPIDPNNLDKSFISRDRLPVAIVFILAIIGLFILLFIERKFRKKKK